MRSQYAPKPTVKILKRPDRNSQSNGQLLNGDKPKQPIKTLKQVYFISIDLQSKLYFG